MARQYGRYLVSTHSDEEWSTLSTLQHDCYMGLVSSEDISWSGIVPYAPARYANFASDLTEKKVSKAWADLGARGMLVIDRAAGEIFVRSFLRHDNVLAKPNLTKAFVCAYGMIRSGRIKDSVVTEVRRLMIEDPDLPGTKTLELFPELFTELFPELFGEPIS